MPFVILLIHTADCGSPQVYMPGGHKTHVKFDDFDIAALINLMSRCTHFQRLIKANKPQKVSACGNTLTLIAFKKRLTK